MFNGRARSSGWRGIFFADKSLSTPSIYTTGAHRVGDAMHATRKRSGFPRS
jgi:hypothetical protein